MAMMTYGEAINNAHALLLESDPRVFLIGEGVDSPWFVGNTTTGLTDRFGKERVIDPPISEAAFTGCAIGAAMAGMRPIVFHPRMDFMYLTLDQIVNHCSNWSFMFGGQVKVPVVIRGIVNRGGEQSTQHSQSPLATYAHIPGLKVVAPATPYDAKGLLISASEDDSPVIYIDDRWLYDLQEDVPDDYYSVELGKAHVRKRGSDITIIGVSYLANEAMIAAEQLESEGISAEVVDICTIKPLDTQTIINSAQKTKRVVVACGDWEFCGLGAYIASIIYDNLFNGLLYPIKQVVFENIHTPASTPLEQAFFKKAPDIIKSVKECINNS